MAKIIYSAYLNKKLSSDQLRSKVGNVQINSDKFAKSLGGTNLKKFITKLGGKTDTQIEKMLKDKYGVSGYQVKKRESIMKLIRGDKETGLTEDEIKRNLRRSMQKDKSWLEKGEHRMSFAGGSITSHTIGAVKTKGTMDDIGIKKGSTGFAQNFNKKQLPNNLDSKAPSAGIRPLGL